MEEITGDYDLATGSIYRCQYCNRLQPNLDKLKEHEERCAENPKMKHLRRQVATGYTRDTIIIQQDIHNLGLRLETLFAELVERVSREIAGVREELGSFREFFFRGRHWENLSGAEREYLLDQFLQTRESVGGRPKPFRPIHFKEYLSKHGVEFSPKIIRYNQDEVSLFLGEQVGRELARNGTNHYLSVKKRSG
ncbi:MAG: hypothetical protein ACTSU5_03895 [Promethearchaeota archaeon]